MERTEEILNTRKKRNTASEGNVEGNTALEGNVEGNTDAVTKKCKKNGIEFNQSTAAVQQQQTNRTNTVTQQRKKGTQHRTERSGRTQR